MMHCPQEGGGSVASSLGLLSREGGPELCLVKQPWSRLGAGRGVWYFVHIPFELRRDCGGSCFRPDPSQSQSGLAWCSHSVKLIMFSRITSRPGCECQASSCCWGCFSLFTAQKNKTKTTQRGLRPSSLCRCILCYRLGSYHTMTIFPCQQIPILMNMPYLP